MQDAKHKRIKKNKQRITLKKRGEQCIEHSQTKKNVRESK